MLELLRQSSAMACFWAGRADRHPLFAAEHAECSSRVRRYAKMCAMDGIDSDRIREAIRDGEMISPIVDRTLRDMVK